jgi:cyclomaltodextrinase
MPVWRPGRTLYQLHSLGAAGGRGFGALQGWLDHVAALGCGGVLLTPIAESSTHGYDTVDPLRVDPRLGGDDDFDRFVAACHERDLHVVLDGVFNHVGREFPPFRDVRERGRDSEYADWFRIDFDGDGPDGFSYHSFEGHDILVSLNHRSPAVLEWAVGAARHWLDRGADGWRFDAAYAIPRPFLAALAAGIRAEHPDAFLFGEVIHGDYVGFVHESTLDAVTQYELHKAIWSSLNDANLFELAWALGRHRGITPVTFVGNHDVTRIASQLADRRHLAAALALLFTLPGVPCVYYGDELGWTGVKEHRLGGDDAIRPALPSSPEGDHEVLALHRDLIALRRDRPWLATADLEVTDVANQRLAYTVRAGYDALDVVIDLADPALYRIS